MIVVWKWGVFPIDSPMGQAGGPGVSLFAMLAFVLQALTFFLLSLLLALIFLRFHPEFLLHLGEP